MKVSNEREENDGTVAVTKKQLLLTLNEEQENNYCLTVRRLAATNEFSTKTGAKWIIRCHGCKEPLSRLMAFRSQLLYTLGNVWHREHLRCIRCHCRVGPDGRDFRPCLKDETLPLCIDCHMEDNHPKCAGCQKTLRETCVKALDKQWHRCCLVCAKCQSPFPNLQFYIFNGKPYDTDCFYLTKYDSLLTSLSQTGNLGVDGGQPSLDQMFANMPTGNGLEPIVTTNKVNTQGPSAPIPDATLLVNTSKDMSVSTASSGTSIADTEAESSSSTISTQVQPTKTRT